MRYGWYTALPEIVVGAWAFIAGLVVLLCNDTRNMTQLGYVLLIISVAVPVLLDEFLRDGLVIPSGMCLVAPKRQPAAPPVVVAAVITCLAVFVAGMFSVHPFETCTGALLGIVIMLAFGRCGRQRLLVLACAVIMFFSLSPMFCDLLDIAPVGAMGLALLLSGIMSLVVGIPAFLRPVSELMATSEQDDRHLARMLSGWFTPDQLAAALASDEPDKRFLAAAFLCEYIEPQVLVPLIRLTQDSDGAVAAMARKALSSIWGPDPEDVLRWQIRYGLGKDGRKGGRGHREMTAGQLEVLDHERRVIEKDTVAHEREVEGVMAQKVGGDTETLNVLIALASDDALKDDGVQFVAAELLGSSRDHRAYATLVQLMLRGDRDLAGAAAEGFRGAAPEAIVHLEPLFDDSREWVRVAAVNAVLGLVSSLDDVDAAQAAQARTMMHDRAFSLARHPKPVTRAMSLELLAKYGEEAMPDIEAACSDRFALVRGEAVRALSLVNAVNAADYVLKALRDPRAYVRGTAVNCVAYLQLKEARPVVKLLVNDPDKTVSSLASRLLFISRNW